MTDTKFTSDEMDKIKEIQSSYVGIQQAFGQVEVGRLRLEQQLDSTQKASSDLRDKFLETQQNEQKFIEELKSSSPNPMLVQLKAAVLHYNDLFSLSTIHEICEKVDEVCGE